MSWSDVPVNQLHPHVVRILIIATLCLLASTAVRTARWWHCRSPVGIDAMRSLISWWALLVTLTLALVLGRSAVIVLVAALSAAGIYEYERLARRQIDTGRLGKCAYALLPLHFACIYYGWKSCAVTIVPIGGLVLVLGWLAVTGRTAGYVHAAGAVYMGWMLIVYCLSHLVFFYLSIPEQLPFVARAEGLLLYVILVTQISDIAQAHWGKKVGRRKITPTVSPHKTWEGFVLGVLTAAVVGVIVGPWLIAVDSTWLASSTQQCWRGAWVATAAVLIPLAGFLGDITMSAIKRDAGVKDSGTWLPGQGGILDRIDSLTFAAPVFYYLTVAWWAPAG